MKDLNNLSSREKISLEMIEDEDFCLSIVNCKSREEVKSFLMSKGIEVNDGDIDNLAKNISEVADICQKLDEKELDRIVGGVGGDDSDSSKAHKWGNFADKTALGLGISGLVVAGFGILAVIAAGIKKKGDEKGWWTKKKSTKK